MRKQIALTVLSAVLLFLHPAIGTARADEVSGVRHVIDEGRIRSEIARHQPADEELRSSIQATLDRPLVRQVAEEHGLDIQAAKSAVGTLQGEELQRIAEEASSVDAALAGGDMIVISSSTLIIILLVILIISVA